MKNGLFYYTYMNWYLPQDFGCLPLISLPGYRAEISVALALSPFTIIFSYTHAYTCNTHKQGFLSDIVGVTCSGGDGFDVLLPRR